MITSPLTRSVRKAGFTLIELFAVIAVIGVLTALLLPALGRAKQKGEGVSCLNGSRQMMLALVLYSNDFNDLFPPNPDDGNRVAGHNWCSGRAGIGGPEEFSPDLLQDPSLSLLIGYLKGNPALFHCPGDRRKGRYQGTNVALAGKILPASRTFSMNQAVGTICPGFDSAPSHAPHYGVPVLPVNGPWLNNENNHRRNSPWRTYHKMSAIASQSPGNLWIFIDENANGLNDAAFAFGMEQAIWYDVPGTYHNGGAGLAFADGHSESHRWVGRVQKTRGPIKSPADRSDWLWMRIRTSASSSGAMPSPR